MSRFRNHVLVLLLTLSPAATVFAGATAGEYAQTFTTYPYSDPDPVPAMTRYYPYFRYDGFTDRPVQKSWKVVELANDYIRLLILPEIGGKVWAAIDKKTGQPFIYYNHVVKFRDVSMRGPWTSGGMEANYGIIGHTPNCFSPVDYTVMTNCDGSVSCVIGTLDLLTRTTWRLEINLPADEAGFSTRSFWHNGSGTEQPYYTWMNVGMKAGGSLQFIHPGTRYLGHDGKTFAWPTNSENGRVLSDYEQNNFGPYKSYHIFGRPAEFFGCYYRDDDFGMAHYADYADKPGRKIWIWGLSRQGMIWERLLTDTDGQYIEVQSGRLFNQTADESTFTPFKHKEFPPYATDKWTEYWQPVAGIKGFVAASPWGAMNVTRDGRQLVVRLSPARTLNDKLEVFDGQTKLFSKAVFLSPHQPVELRVPLEAEPKSLKVCLGGDKLQFVANAGDELTRPQESPPDFNWNDEYGLFLQGLEDCRERNYPAAATNLQACLKLNPNYVPALVEMASILNRHAGYETARVFARRALSVDTYDGGANFQFGQASAALGLFADAADAFSVAALSVGWRSAAFTELAKLQLRGKNYDRALSSDEKALDCDRHNLDAIQIQIVAHRLRGDAAAAADLCRTLLGMDSLSHFARFELLSLKKIKPAAFTNQIRNELPVETYLELAARYRSVGLDATAASVLELAPANAEALLWLAYLRQDTNLLARATAASPEFVFPFRAESIPVFEWAGRMSGAWQPRYFLALIRWSNNEISAARELLTGCGDEPKFAPFYAVRAQLFPEAAETNLQRAAQLDPGQWRYSAMLAKYQLAQSDHAGALRTIGAAHQRFPGNNVIALLYAKALLLNGQFEAVVKLLRGLDLLPCEGSTDARETLRTATLLLALEKMKSGDYAQALPLINTAREWPENLGAGKPYPEDADERLEDWLYYQCCLQLPTDSKAAPALQRIIDFNAAAKPASAGDIVRFLALKTAGRGEQLNLELGAWLEKKPSPEMAAWARQVLAGDGDMLPAGLQESGCRVLAAWLSQQTNASKKR